MTSYFIVYVSHITAGNNDEVDDDGGNNNNNVICPGFRD
jgi:hypothetical protein